MASSPPSILASATRGYISAQIIQQLRVLAGLRVRFNALTPINARLPPEILSQIFVWCAAGTKRNHPRRLLSITWVCHYWREPALSTHAFWVNLLVAERFVRYAMLRSSLERAGPRVALQIRENIQDVDSPHTQLILPHFNRAQKLTLCGRPEAL